MIKVTIQEEERKVEKTYPKLMISKDRVIVLFDSDGCGMVMAANAIHAVGRFSERWAMEQFTDFNGSVTLKNE